MARISAIFWASALLLSNGALAEPNVTCTAVTPTPSGLSCGKNVTPRTDYYTDNFPGAFKSDNLTFCRDTVAKFQGYGGFAWSPSAKLCYPYKWYGNVQANFTSGSSVYYDTGCFKCADNCPQPKGQNIFPNGDFEWPWVDLTKDSPFVGGGFASPGSGSPQATVSTGQDPRIDGPYRTTCPGAVGFYYISADWKLTYTGSPARSVIFYAASSFTLLSGELATTGTNTAWSKWEDYLAVWYPGSSINTEILSYSYGNTYNNTKLFVDNINGYYVGSTFSPVANSANLVSNPGFEGLSLGPWTANKYVKIISPGLKGSKKAASFYRSDDFFDPARIQQTVAVTKGTHYLLTFDWQKNNTDASSPTFTLVNGPNSGSYTDEKFDSQSTAQSGTYKRPFVAQASNVTFSLSMSIYGDNFIVDNFAIQPLIKP